MQRTLSIFRAALDCSPDAIFLIDRRTMRFIDVNATACKSVGFSRDELLAMGPGELKPRLPADALAEQFDRVIAGQVETGIIETVHRRRDGSEFPVEVYVRLASREGDAVLVAVARDITERKRSAEALQEAERRFRQLATYAPVAIFLMDSQGQCVFVNESWTRLTGQTLEQTLGRGWGDMLYPDDRDRIVQKWAYASEHQLPFADEFRLRGSEGQIVWVYSVATVLRDCAGRLTGHIGTATDITARKHAEEALVLEHQATDLERRRLQAILDLLPVGLFISDAAGHLLEANAAARVIWRATPLVAVGQWTQYKAWWPSTGRPLRPEEWALARALREGRIVSDEEVDIETFDGVRRSILVYATPIHGPDGQLVGGAVAIVDITRRKAIERELKVLNETLEHRVRDRTAEAERRTAQLRALASELVLAEERERRALAADLHDDLGQILTLCRIKLSLAKQPLDTAAGKAIKEAGELIDRANQLTRSLTFQLSPPILHELGLVPAVEWLAEELQRLYGLRIGLDTRTAPRSISENTRLILFRSIRELLINIARHARATRANLSMQAANGILTVTVSDDGRGFDYEAAMRRTRGGGFGLFSISERLAHLGGRMDVRTSPGLGSTVVLSLPLGEPIGEASTQAAQPAGEAVEKEF